MKKFINYPLENFIPFKGGLTYDDVPTELAEEIAKDFPLFIRVRDNNTNELYIDLGNGFALYFSTNQYKKGLFNFIAEYNIHNIINHYLLKYEGKQMYSYSKKAMQKFVDFYTEEFNCLANIELQFIAEKEILHKELLEKDFIYFNNVNVDFQYKQFGLYYTVYAEIVGKVTKQKELVVSLQSHNRDSKILEFNLFKEYLNRGHILSYFDFETYMDNQTLNETEVYAYKSVKDALYLLLLRAVNFDFEFKHKDIKIEKKDNRVYLNGKVTPDYDLSNLKVEPLLCLNNYLISLLKKATN